MIKKRYLLFIIIVFLLAISAVSASDNINETQLTANNGNEFISNVNNNEILGVTNGTYSELITEIGSGGDITLSKDYYKYDSGDTIIITQPGTINGNGAVIDMSGKNMRTLNINASDVTLFNITFKNMNVDDYDGSIHFMGSGTVRNCNFMSNCARYGACLNFEGDAVVNDSIFINNVAIDGAAIYAASGIVNNCIFINNTGHNTVSDGAAVYFTYAGTFKNCNFTNNSVENMGGAIRCGSASLIDACNFINNKASVGGAVTISSGNVKNSNFIDNSVKLNEFGTFGDGGAIFFSYQSYATKTVENCNFTHNTAVFNGGAIYCQEDSSECTYDIKNSTFINNRASNGGAVQVSKAIGIDSCAFINNTASSVGGALRLSGADNRLKNCTFINNTANDGGAIRFELSTSIYGAGSMVNCNFTGNTATQNGGAVTIIDLITADSCNFINNSASKGSAVFVGNSGRYNNVFQNCTFLDNRADSLQLNITKEDDKIRIVFKGKNNLLNAIYANHDVDFYNVVYWGADGINNTGNTMVTLARSENEAGQNISILAIFDNTLILNTTEVTDINGQINLDCPVAGGYIIKASHKADSYYTQIDNSISNIKYNVTMNIDAPEIFEGESAVVNVTISPNNATGSVTVGNITHPVESGNVSFIISGLPIGTTTLPVFYSGDDIFNNASASVDIIVNPKRVLTIDAADISMAYGDNESLIATFTYEGDYVEVPVAITINDDIKDNMTSTGGKITLDDLNKWSVGNYTVNFTVNTSKYWGNKTVKITIAKATPDFTVKDISLNISENDTIIINNIKSDPNPIFNNQSNNLSIARVIDGIVYGVGGGNTTITVTIMESENYTSLSKNLTVTVYKIATTINIDSPSVIIYAGQNQTTGASLYPSEAGELTYQSRDESIAIVENGLIIAKCEGNVIIEVSFAGNSRYAEAENKTIEVSVNLNNASVNVNNNTLDLEVEDNFTIIATTTPDGLNVNFTSSDDSVVTVDNEGNVKAIGKGTATITVSVGGDGVYVLNSTDVTVTVRDKPVPKKDLNITASTFTLGENVTVIVTGFENATGNVTVTAGDNNYTSSIMMGMAFVSIPKSDKNITAYIYYPGDDNYNNASATVDIIAKKDLNITAIADQIFIGENATIIVNGFENATGNVSVIAGRGFYNASIINGTATVVTAGLNNSTTAYILYLGDDNYNMAFTSVNITVNPKSDVVIVAENVTKYYGGPERFIANIYDSELNPLVNKSVNITINGVTYTRKTDDNGTVSMAIRLGSGTYNVTTQVDNTTLKSSITVLSTVIGSDITKYYKNATQYSVQVYDTNGKAVGKGEVVTFNVNGIFYNRTTDENGIATLNINLPPSSYIITAEYKGCRIANNITVLPVLNATDITMKYLDGTQFKANLVDGQGKPYKDQFITFNINGKFYDRLTDSNGQAKLNIRLPPGEYIITSSFNGLNIANKITITA